MKKHLFKNTSLIVIPLILTNLAGPTLSGHAQPCSPPPAGLVSWWPLDGNALDAKGGNSGVLSGGPVFTSGKVGQAMIFDFSNDHVRVPASAA